MKRIIGIIVSALICLGVLSCQKDGYPEGADLTSLRVAVVPAPSSIPAAGATFEAAVVVNQGPYRDVPWTVSVDGDLEWVSVTKIRYTSHFTGTYAGDDTDVEQDGISCTLSVNDTGRKRLANLRFTTADGRSIIYTVTQLAK